jgi:hypothetical protein
MTQQRSEVLRDLAVNGHSFAPSRLAELSSSLGLLLSDVYAVAGQPVPPHLLPPARDLKVLRGFTYRVTFCRHPELAALTGFIQSLPSDAASPSPPTDDEPQETGFASVLKGLMRNRGLGIHQLPFTGLSISTIRGMQYRGLQKAYQLKAMAGPLGWTLPDLAAVAGEPLGPFDDCSTLCHHFGRVFMAAIPLTTPQLIRAATDADRLSGRTDHGSWQPWNDETDACPDGLTLSARMRIASPPTEKQP